MLRASAEGVVCVAWSPTCSPEVAEGPRLPAWQGRVAPKMTQCVARPPERPACSPSSAQRQARPVPLSLLLSLMSSASLAGVRLTASRVRTQARWDPCGHGPGEGPNVSGNGGPTAHSRWCARPERPRKFSKQLQSQGRRGKGTWDHSGLVPDETFRYQVKVLALSKAQTKVLPLPCPPDTQKRHRQQQQQQRQQQAQNPSLEGSRQLPSCWASPWCQRQRPEPSDHLEGSWSQQR